MIEREMGLVDFVILLKPDWNESEAKENDGLVKLRVRYDPLKSAGSDVKGQIQGRFYGKTFGIFEDEAGRIPIYFDRDFYRLRNNHIILKYYSKSRSTSRRGELDLTEPALTGISKRFMKLAFPQYKPQAPNNDDDGYIKVRDSNPGGRYEYFF